MKGRRAPVTPPPSHSARPTPGTVQQLEAEIERLLLVTEALWGIVRDRLEVEEAELLRRMVQIDLRDGRLDGRLPTSAPEPCPKCQRMVSARALRCLYCGEPMMVNPFAR